MSTRLLVIRETSRVFTLIWNYCPMIMWVFLWDSIATGRRSVRLRPQTCCAFHSRKASWIAITPARKRVEPATTASAKNHARLAAGEYWLSKRFGPNSMQEFSIIAEYLRLKINILAIATGSITTHGFLT